MIAWIFGTITLVNTQEASVIVSQNGLGYLIFVGHGCVKSKLVGQEVVLFVETIVRENAITLYGFETYEKQIWFRSMMKVSGVGAKIALTVVENLSPNTIVSSIVNNDAKAFESISGLGAKIAQKIIVELKNEPVKNSKMMAGIFDRDVTMHNHGTSHGELSYKNESQKLMQKTENTDSSVQNKVNIHDVVSALENLGFDKNTSFNVAHNVLSEATSLENAIILALKKISAN